MKIETKLNIGNDCFFMQENRVVKKEITNINIYVKSSEKRIEYVFTRCDVKDIKTRNEDLVFATKDELLASL